jgi:hypothetical protein
MVSGGLVLNSTISPVRHSEWQQLRDPFVIGCPRLEPAGRYALNILVTQREERNEYSGYLQ